MRKTPLPALALVLCTSVLCASGVEARPRVTEISLDGYCNIYHVTINGLLAAAQDTPSCSGNFGGGLVATVKNFGKSADIALQDQVNHPGVQLMLVLSYPFVTGGQFKLYQTTDGLNFQDMLDGTYSIHGAPEEGAKGPSSATAALRH